MKRSIYVTGWLACILFALMFILVLDVDGADTDWVQETPEPSVTPGPIDGFIARLFINGYYQDFTCYPANMAPTPTWETTETPLPTALPPTATATATPSATATLTPSPTATPEPLCTGTVTADTLNVRSGPSRTASVIGKLYLGDQVGIITRVLSTAGEWWYFIYEHPASYVIAEYVRLDEDTECPF